MSKISGILPLWTASLDIISEPPRTEYSGEPELYRFLARTKVCERSLRLFDMCSDQPFYFFELSGESEVVLWGKILFRTVYRHT